MAKWIVLLTLLLITNTVQAQGDDLEPQTMIFEGFERSYVLYKPDDLEIPAPLVLVLHGRFGNGESMRRSTRFNAVAEREGFIVAYPDGLDAEWNYVRGIPGYPNTHDDVAFLIALVDEIAATHEVDLSRVYVTGFSNGGFMAQRIACENPTHFAAFASVAAAGFGGMTGVCMETGSEKAPMLLINGTEDTNVPWEGTGVTRDGRTVYVTYPVPDTLGYWAEFNGCQPNAETSDVPPGGESPETSVRILTVDCPEDGSVVLYSVIGGGHNWPGQEAENVAAYGNVSHDIDASEVIWEFFAGHERLQEATE